VGDLEAVLRAWRSGGGSSFVPYVTGGFPGVDAGLLHAIQDAGADALEIGIPFSDPVMDGGVIQETSRISLERGTRPSDILDMIGRANLTIPVVVMTYVNPVYRRGFESFLDAAASSGVAGVVVPDLPVDEAEDLDRAAADRGVDAVLLAAPGTEPDRLALIGERSRGFVYCVATYGVTGARDSLAHTAADLVAALRPLTDLPLLVGVGIATPEQAAEACGFADGVIVGTALMARLVEDGANGMMEAARAFRAAIPG
jgi:tryptophan synthase alpha chain